MKPVIVGITGASGTIYGLRLLAALRRHSVETHLIVTEAARKVAEIEVGSRALDLQGSVCQLYDDTDLGAPLASGSFPTEGMVIIPCSVKSLSAVANSYTETLLSRAADVTLKERRKLVLVVRESPLHLGHLRLMARATELGAVILPPVPSFYHRPRTVEDIVDHTVGKVLAQFGLEHRLFAPWPGAETPHRPETAHRPED